MYNTLLNFHYWWGNWGWDTWMSCHDCPIEMANYPQSLPWPRNVLSWPFSLSSPSPMPPDYAQVFPDLLMPLPFPMVSWKHTHHTSWFVEFDNFRGVNTLILVDFKLPAWCLKWSWKEKHILVLSVVLAGSSSPLFCPLEMLLFIL